MKKQICQISLVVLVVSFGHILRANSQEFVMASKSTTNSTGLITLTLAESRTNVTETISGQEHTQPGYLLSLTQTVAPSKGVSTTNTVWAGFLQGGYDSHLPWPLPHGADFLYDVDSSAYRIAIGEYGRFSIYSISTNNYSNSEFRINQLARLMPPGSLTIGQTQLSPDRLKFESKTPPIKHLSLLRDGRYWVVRINDKLQFKYSTWTGQWSSFPVP